MAKSIYQVGQINRYIKGLFTQDVLLNHVSVRGEVSNLKYHTSGHIYFSLKDADGALRCVMFRSHRAGLAHRMKDGDKVVVTGSVNVYERDGTCQLYATQIEPEGEGLLYEQFLKLKKELEEMGMFDPLYKKPIPRYARRVGVITAPTGAAVRDIQNISARRNPYVQLILYPALVQGEGAVASLVKGLEVMDHSDVDVIIIGRGGGSLEDLWAFNDESVARAIFQCQTPVISAVGHETDTTIADFVADLRAPTPSASAELAFYEAAAYEKKLLEYQRELYIGMSRHLIAYRSRLKQLQVQMNYLSPRNQLNEKRRYLLDLESKLSRSMQTLLEDRQDSSAYLEERLRRAMADKYRSRQHALERYIQRFKGLNPLDKLSQGFSYTSDENGQAIRSIHQKNIGDRVKIQVTDGAYTASIEAIEAFDRKVKIDNG
ncbi:MAG: exodeoxyribonuclease VII large subunit [Lachnospiraceae bacterium]|nr:exodeoxyribonuclease VII large subunit [Candidatus Equihabitans merdae]